MTNHEVVLAIYIITLLIGFPSNLLSLCTFITKVRKKPAPVDILLLNLTLSDIVFLTFLPLKMTEAAKQNEWPFPKVLCNVTSCTFHSTIYISILFLTAISVDRYLGVAFPIKYRLNRRSAYAVVASIFIWVLVGSHCSVIIILSNLQNRSSEASPQPSDHVVCFKEFNEKQKPIIYPFRLELCIALFCIPFVITSFCYINVIRILASLPLMEAYKKQRSVGLAVVTLLNFTVCFGPFNFSHIWGVIHSKDPSWREYAFVLSSFNTCLDPFIFFFSSNAIRRNLRVCWVGLSRRVRPLLPRCSLCHCKDSRDNNEGTGAVGLSTSSEVKGTGATESSSCGYSAKTREVTILNPDQEAYCSQFQAPVVKESSRTDSCAQTPV